MTMICGNCNQTGIRWMRPMSQLTHTECPHCGGTNCQLADQPDLEEAEFPSWAHDNGDGTFTCECASCGRDCDVDYMTRDEIINCGEPYRFLGGCSERCIP